MAFQYLTTVPLDRAKKEYMEFLIENGMTPLTETVPAAETAGRVLAGPVYARISAPHYNACAMDGIALRAKLTAGANETSPVSLTTGEYIWVNTGDALPESCDAVVMTEDVIEAGGGLIKLYEAAVPWQHVRQIGEDICAGEMILPSYSLVTAAGIGALMASGVTEADVIKRPVVGLIPTGDELVTPSADPKQGEIIEFNSSIFSAMLRDWGAETIPFPIVPDDLTKIREAINTALEQCDAVIVNAGSSAGSEDYAAAAIAECGAVLHHGIAIKPGKPAILGRSGAKPVLGVPGYPVSGIIVIEQFMRPIVEFLGRKAPTPHCYEDAVLSKSIVSSLKYQKFVRVRMWYV